MKMVHVTINTSDLEKSIDFYEKAIGLGLEVDLRDNLGLPIVFLSDGESVQLELIENKDGAFNGSGISIGFKVDQLEETYRTLKEKGYNPTEYIEPVENVKFFFIKDPNGVNIQII